MLLVKVDPELRCLLEHVQAENPEAGVGGDLDTALQVQVSSI